MKPDDKRPLEAWQEIARSNKNGQPTPFSRRLLPDNLIHDGSKRRARVE
jgi:hypothetical protein